MSYYHLLSGFPSRRGVHIIGYSCIRCILRLKLVFDIFLASCGILLMVYAEFALLKEMRKTKDFTRGWPFFTAYAGAALSIVAVICCWIAFCLKPLEKSTNSSVYYDSSNFIEYDNQPVPTPQLTTQRLALFSYDNDGYVASRQHQQTLYDVPLRDYPMSETYRYTKSSSKKNQVQTS